MSFDFNNWIRQPSTLHGLGVLAAGIGAGLTHLATGNPVVDGVFGMGAYVLVHLGVDDHSAAEQTVTAFVTDLLSGAAPARIVTDGAAAATNLATILPTPAHEGANV